MHDNGNCGNKHLAALILKREFSHREGWDVSDVGIAPYGNGLDFLDWIKDFLDGKVME